MQNSFMATLKAWWKEFRRPKCEWCGVDVPKGEKCCERKECVEMWQDKLMGA